MSSRRIAVVAIGSTSVHLTVARVSDRELRRIADESVLFELGPTVDALGRVPSDRLDGLLRELELYAKGAARMHAGALTIVATEPLRRASNARAVVDAVRTATSGAVHVLGHDEEALLSLHAVLGGRPPHADTLVVDIGGGSSEYAIAGPGRVPVVDVVRTGAARLTDAFVRADPPAPEEFAAAREAARSALARTVEAAPGAAIMVGGTATNLLRLVAGTAPWRSLTRARLEEAVRILGQLSIGEITTRYPIRPQRARILPGGAALAWAFLERYRLRSATVSQASIREGLILAIARAGDDWRERLPELVGGPPGPGARG